MNFRVLEQRGLENARSPFRVVEDNGQEVQWVNRFLDQERVRSVAETTLRSYAYKLDAALDGLMHTAPIREAGKKLQHVIKGCRRYLFVFLADRAIPPTNNGSKQALRPCVIFRKVTNCFRSQWGANLYADIRSTIETARRRAIGALQAIHLTLNGKPLPVPITRPSG